MTTRRITSATLQNPNRASQRMTSAIPAKADKIVDSRQPRDSVYIQQCAERVHSYFVQMSTENVPTVKQLCDGVALRPFLDMFTKLIEILDIGIDYSIKDIKNFAAIFDIINNVQTMLGYPETHALKINDLKSCSTPQVWRKFLLLLTWLLELTDYVCKVSTEPAPEEMDVIFIKELCQSQDPQHLINSKQYFNFLSQQYEEFLKNEGNETSLKQNLQVLFQLWSEEAKMQEQKLLAEIKHTEMDMRKQRQELENQVQSARLELNAVIETAVSANVDIQLDADTSYVNQSVVELSPQQLLELKQRNLQRLQEANLRIEQQMLTLEQTTNPQLQDKADFLQQQLNEHQQKVQQLQQELEVISKNVREQDVSVVDYNKLKFNFEQLQQQFKSLEIDLNETNSQIKEKEERKQRLTKQINQLMQQLNIQGTQFLTIDEITKRQNELRRKNAELEKTKQKSQQQFNETDNQKNQLNLQIAALSEQLNIAEQRAKTAREEKDRVFENQQQRNEYYAAGISRLVSEITQLRSQQQKMQADLEDSKIILQNQQVLYEREQKRCDAELRKLSTVVAVVLEQITASRQKARNALEMVRDKLGEFQAGVE